MFFRGNRKRGNGRGRKEHKKNIPQLSTSCGMQYV
ncbi:Uncharacterised protein [Segatella copri]|nr:Uncharacterised protein [Segatella copri]